MSKKFIILFSTFILLTVTGGTLVGHFWVDINMAYYMRQLNQSEKPKRLQIFNNLLSLEKRYPKHKKLQIFYVNMPEWKKIVEGFSSKKADIRFKTFRKALSNPTDPIQMNLLKRCLQNRNQKPIRNTKYSSSFVRTGEPIKLQWKYLLAKDSVWLPNEELSPAPLVWQCTHKIILYKNKVKNSYRRYGGGRSRGSPLTYNRLFPINDPQLSGHVVVKAPNAGYLSWKWKKTQQSKSLGFIGFPWPSLGIKPLVLNVAELSSETKNPEKIPVLPMEALFGATVNGLNLKADWTRNSFDTISKSYSPEFEITIEAADNRPHKIIYSTEKQDFGFWALICSKNNRFVWMNKRKYVGIKLYNKNTSFRTLQKGINDNLKIPLSFGKIKKPGDYKVFIGYGKFEMFKEKNDKIESYKNYWVGELIAKPITFSIDT